MKYELVIFDCDGVLVDSEFISTGVLAEEARKLGSSLSNQDAYNVFSGTSLDFCVKYIEDEIGKPVPENFITNFRTISFKKFETELEPIDGVLDLIKNLNLKFCVASNAPKSKVGFNLKKVGFFPYFEKKIFSAYEIQAWKPDPKLFLTAAKTMGIDPRKCIVIEDSIPGVKAGVAAGMKVLGYSKTDKSIKLERAGATIIESMSEANIFIQENS